MFYSYIVADSKQLMDQALSKLNFPDDIIIRELNYYTEHEEFQSELFAIMSDDFFSTRKVVVLISPADMVSTPDTRDILVEGWFSDVYFSKYDFGISAIKRIVSRANSGYLVRREDDRVAIMTDKHKKQPRGKVVYGDIK